MTAAAALDLDLTLGEEQLDFSLNSTLSSVKSESQKPEAREENERSKVSRGVATRVLFGADRCAEIEGHVERVRRRANRGGYGVCTVDRAPLRTKYFFGEGYIYGKQLGSAGGERKGPGGEKLYPSGECDPIPGWIFDLVVEPVVSAGIIPEGFVNSVVINDYAPGGCIVSHIDPPQLFDSDSALCFGCRFSYRPMRISEPVYRVELPRGCVMTMEGFAADGITHCVRPEDVPNRRAVIILRHVPSGAPRLTPSELAQLRYEGVLPAAKQERSSSRDAEEDRGRAKKRRRSLPLPRLRSCTPPKRSSLDFQPLVIVCSSYSDSEEDGSNEQDKLHKRVSLNCDMLGSEEPSRKRRRKDKSRDCVQVSSFKTTD